MNDLLARRFSNLSRAREVESKQFVGDAKQASWQIRDDAFNSQPLGFALYRIPIKLSVIHQLGDVAQPGKLNPYVFGGVNRKYEQEIFRAQGSHGAFAKVDHFGAVE